MVTRVFLERALSLQVSCERWPLDRALQDPKDCEIRPTCLCAAWIWTTILQQENPAKRKLNHLHSLHFTFSAGMSSSMSFFDSMGEHGQAHSCALEISLTCALSDIDFTHLCTDTASNQPTVWESGVGWCGEGWGGMLTCFHMRSRMGTFTDKCAG